MPIEQLEGSNVYVDDLNERWPLDSDYISSFAYHMRGVKNVLKNVFPNVDGPITKTTDELNEFTVPAGSVMLFYQQNPPTGWSKVEMADTYSVKIVKGTAKGGSTAGQHDPVKMDKVPQHTHPNTVDSGDGTHTHVFTTNSGGSHSHSLPFSTSGANLGSGAEFTLTYGSGELTGVGGAHTHGATATGGAHNHTVTNKNNTGANAVAWEPRYANVIVCSKD